MKTAKRKDFNCVTYSEGRTGGGQAVGFYCRPEDVSVVKDFFIENVERIHISETKCRCSIQHGSYGQYTRFDVEQHKYAGGGSGFIEVLEIKNPPDDRCGFILYERPSSSQKCFSEWETVEDAKNAFEKCWGTNNTQKKYDEFKGFKRMVHCGLLIPWFYAIGDEALVGDYAFPDGLQDDPVFRFGEKFVVYGDEKIEIKTCMGCKIIQRVVSNYYGSSEKKYDERVVYWQDGTIWSNTFSNSDNQPRKLENDEMWIFEAMEEFKKLLSGQKEDFIINFTNDTKFVGKIVPGNDKKISKEGRYNVLVTFEDGTTKGGYVDFKPTLKYPDLISYVREGIEHVGKEVKKIEIQGKKTKPMGKKWSGVFFTK